MITNQIYKDGFGENLKFIIYAIMYAEYLNEEFHYTKLSNIIEHNYDNDPEFINNKEKLINIINHYPIAKNEIEYKKPSKFALLHFFEKNIDFCFKSNCLKKLKNIFKEVNQDKFDKTFFNIAIHIRKMNILDIKQKPSHIKMIPGTDVPINVYKEIIQQLKKLYKNCRIHVYSQTEENNSKENSFDFEDDIILHLDETTEISFIDFVYADVLVVAPSAFSYTSAILSDGIIYYIDSCHKPLPSWNLIQNYTSTHNRYSFSTKSKINVFYDTKIGQFYKEDINTREYINIHEYI